MNNVVKNGRTNAIIRIITLFVLLVNQILIWLGYNPIPYSDEQIFEGVSWVVMVVVVLWSTWKNNNVTDVALAGQSEIERLKERENNDNQ